MHGVWPVSSALQVVESRLLADEVLLRRLGHGHVACVSAESWHLALWADVVMGRAAVPEQKVARLRVDLDPLAPLLLQPLETSVGEAVPLVCPSPDLVLLVFECFVELLAQQMGALAHNQASIPVAVGEDVDQALEAAETRLLWVLILVRPRLVGFDVGAPRKGSVDGVKGHDQVLRVVCTLKGLDDSRLLTDGPGEGLMSNSISNNHPLFGDYWQVVILDRGWIVSLEAKSALTASVLVTKA